MKAVILIFGLLVTTAQASSSELLSCSAPAEDYEEAYFSNACDEGFSISPVRCRKSGEVKERILWCKMDSLGIGTESVTCRCN